ncbi:hypothetical protein [Sediminibacter sp. Hel_I_10]|uniref:hypothetical protein n=1 Tax=Sediminibacter sp. Hel_I_10 TaxID=1392490 RepID=UPI0018CC0AA5|nr:hypothetical protein [Sediminibacter sp. Hel_I_10]
MLLLDVSDKSPQSIKNLKLFSKVFEAYLTSDYASDADERSEALVLFKDLAQAL